MPEISRFFGLVIQMFLRDHPPPHIHVRYGSYRAKVRLAPVELLEGALPPRPLAMVVHWARLHEAELLDSWRRLEQGWPPLRVAPLE